MGGCGGVGVCVVMGGVFVQGISILSTKRREKKSKRAERESEGEREGGGCQREERKKRQEREENIRGEHRNLGREKRGGQRYHSLHLSLSVCRPGSLVWSRRAGAEGGCVDGAGGGAECPFTGAASDFQLEKLPKRCEEEPDAFLRRQKVRGHPRDARSRRVPPVPQPCPPSRAM